MCLNDNQKASLSDIIQSFSSTNGGAAWPESYEQLFHRWGYFNSIYNTLYSNNEEWKRIAQFSLDHRFSGIWGKIQPTEHLISLASEACVGNGRNNYIPKDHIRISFHVLRQVCEIELNDICKSNKCRKREEKNILLCSDYRFPNPPEIISEVHHAIFTPLGATLSVICQIRNNLFHGSKQEIQDPQFSRNVRLIESSNNIVGIVLSETIEIISSIIMQPNHRST